MGGPAAPTSMTSMTPDLLGGALAQASLSSGTPLCPVRVLELTCLVNVCIVPQPRPCGVKHRADNTNMLGIEPFLEIMNARFTELSSKP